MIIRILDQYRDEKIISCSYSITIEPMVESLYLEALDTIPSNKQNYFFSSSNRAYRNFLLSLRLLLKDNGFVIDVTELSNKDESPSYYLCCHRGKDSFGKLIMLEFNIKVSEHGIDEKSDADRLSDSETRISNLIAKDQGKFHGQKVEIDRWEVESIKLEKEIVQYGKKREVSEDEYIYYQELLNKIEKDIQSFPKPVYQIEGLSSEELNELEEDVLYLLRSDYPQMSFETVLLEILGSDMIHFDVAVGGQGIKSRKLSANTRVSSADKYRFKFGQKVDLSDYVKDLVDEFSTSIENMLRYQKLLSQKSNK